MLAKPAFVIGLFLLLIPGLLAAPQRANAPQPSAEGRHQPGILMLNVDDVSRPWVNMIADGFREAALRLSEQPVLYFESLDAVRFEEPEFLGRQRDWLRFKYRNVSIDMVVTIGEESLRFLSHQHGEPWPDAAVLYMEVGGVSAESRAGLSRATGVIFEDQFPAALHVIKKILPDTERVAIVTGASDVEVARFSGFPDKVRRTNLGLEPLVLGGLPIADIVKRVGSLPPHTAVFMLAPVVDAKGQVLSPTRPCELISPVANGPTFTMGRQDVGCGVVGGLVRNWNIVGRILAEEAMARLRGGPVQDVVHVPMSRFSSLVFDARQLDRWKIPESRLPAGSVVEYRRPSLWRDYRKQTLAVLGVIALQTALIVGLVFEHRRRRRAEVEARRHFTTMAHLDRRAAMGQLTASLAHELNQPLGAILRNAEAASMVLASGEPKLSEVKEIVEDIRRDDKRAAAVIRRLRALLQKHELEMELLDMNEVAQESVAVAAPDASARHVSLELELCNPPGVVHGDRVHLQQALLNLMLNGLEALAQMPPNLRKLTIRTACGPGSVDVSVSDNGPGIAPDVAPHIFEPFFSTKTESGGMGLGLSITRSIIEAHGGTLTAHNNDGHGGATVRFSLPQRRERVHDEAGLRAH